MIRRYTVALMQMDTQNDKGKNLETACAWIDEAAAKGAKLICFPEVMNLIGKNIGEGGGREEIPGYTTERLCAKAKEHGVYIHGGSITQALPGEKRSANTSVLISPEGEILAKYSKLHMFDITLADGTPDGCVQGSVFGTYLHGLFDSGELTEKLAALLCRRKGLAPETAAPLTMQAYREQQFDLLADGVRRALDMSAIYAAMGLAAPKEERL